MGNYNRGAVQCGDHSGQIVYPGPLSACLPRRSIQGCPLDRWWLRLFMRSHHEPAGRGAVQASKGVVGPFRGGRMYPLEYGIHSIRVIKRPHRYSVSNSGQDIHTYNLIRYDRAMSAYAISVASPHR